MSDTHSPFGRPLQALGGLVVLIKPQGPAQDVKPQMRCRILDGNGGLVASATLIAFPAAAYVREATPFYQVRHTAAKAWGLLNTDQRVLFCSAAVQDNVGVGSPRFPAATVAHACDELRLFRSIP